MNILFNLQYATVFGETLQLNVVDRNGAKAQTYGMNMTADKRGLARWRSTRR